MLAVETGDWIAHCPVDRPADAPALVRERAALLPRGRRVEIAGAACLPCVENPAGTWAAINAFLEDEGIV